MIACFICYFVHVTSASYHCFMCMYILWLHLEEFRLSIQAELPGLADNAFDWKRMLWPCDPPSPQPHCRLPGAASFFLRKETEKKYKYERHLQMCA